MAGGTPGWDPATDQLSPPANRAGSSVGVLIAASLWRIVLAGCAFFGLWSSMTGDRENDVNWFNLNYFSQITSLLIGVTAVGALLSPLWNRGTVEGRRGFLRGASVTCGMLTAIVFATLLEGDYGSDGSLFEHLITPVLALIDWIFVVRNAARVQAWWPLVWLAVPLAYLPFYTDASVQNGRPLYDFLDPDASDFLLWMLALLAGYLVLGYLVWAAGRLRGLVGTDPLSRNDDDADRTDGRFNDVPPTDPGWPTVSDRNPAAAPDGSAAPGPTAPAPNDRPPTQW